MSKVEITTEDIKTGVRNTGTVFIAFAKVIVLCPVMIASAPAEMLFYGWRRSVLATVTIFGALFGGSVLTGVVVDVGPTRGIGYFTVGVVGSIVIHYGFNARYLVGKVWADLQEEVVVGGVEVEESPRELDSENVTVVNTLSEVGVDAQEVKLSDKQELDGESDSSDSSDSSDEVSSDIPDTRNRTEYITKPPEVGFDDVAGMDGVKKKLRDRIIEPVENPGKYEKYGLTVANGFLLYGPPGTGKTYLSKALAGELDVNYANVKGTDIISKWVGEAPQNVTRLFEEARKFEPCLLFVDELDAIASERGDSGQHQMQTQVVNQLLEEISEINEKDLDIVVIAATNRKDIIDDAIIRSGRLGEKIEIGMPDAQSRIAILDKQLDAPRADSLDLGRFKSDTEGLSAADMEQVSINAAREAMSEDVDVGNKHVRLGIENINSDD